MKKNWLLLFLLFLAVPAFAQLSEIGLDPLEVEVSGRTLGMGGVYTGLYDDADAAFFNPGGLAWARGISLSLKDPDNIVAVEAYPTGYGSSLGLSVARNKIAGIPVTGGTANSTSNVVFVSLGGKLTFLPALAKNPLFQHLGVGLNIKGLMSESLTLPTPAADRTANGWDADLGLLWRGGEWWAAGLSLQNILPAGTLGAGKFIWNNKDEEGIPAVGKISYSARLIGDVGSGSPAFIEGRELVVGGELDVHNAGPTLMRLGGEYGFDKTFYLRAGLMQQQGQGKVSTDINFGLGMRFDQWGADLSSYREALTDSRAAYISFDYFPKEWVVVKSLDVERPALVLETAIESLSLVDNAVTYDDRIEIAGKVKPGVEVYINSMQVALAPDNSFKNVIPLQMEKNLIIVEARYQGERKSWKYKVLRKAKVELAEEKKLNEELKRATSAEEKRRLEQQEQALKKEKEKVEALVTMGVIEVSPEADFVMEAGITRGELASWLVKAAGMKLPEVNRNLFPDVPKDHPLAPYIKVTVDMNLLRPFSDGTFRPNAFVTKQEGDEIFARFGVAR